MLRDCTDSSLFILRGLNKRFPVCLDADGTEGFVNKVVSCRYSDVTDLSTRSRPSLGELGLQLGDGGLQMGDILLVLLL